MRSAMLYRGLGRSVNSALVLVLLAACSSIPRAPTPTPPGGLPNAQTPTSHGQPIAPTTTIGMPRLDPSPTPEPPTPQAEPQVFRRVEVAAGGMSFEVPEDWIQQEGIWAWSPQGVPDAHIEFLWREIVPPMEPEAVLLPTPSVIQDAAPVTLSWGNGRRITIEVYEQSDAVQAPLKAIELHMLVVTAQGQLRLGYDFHLSAPSADTLMELEPIFQHMLDSSTPL